MIRVAGACGLALLVGAGRGMAAEPDEYLDWRTARGLADAWGQIAVDFARGNGPYVDLREALVYPIPGAPEASSRERLQGFTACMTGHVLAPEQTVALFVHGCTPAETPAASSAP